MNMNKNVLITSVGKRGSLVNLFKETLSHYFTFSRVFTTDMNPMQAPAGFLSDKCFQVPRVTDDDYIEILLEICINNSVQIVIPTIDTELLVLSRYKYRFDEINIALIVSDYDFICTCRDKRNTSTYFQGLNIRVPSPIDKYNPIFPLFAKPYDGSLSKDLYVIKNKKELTTEILNHPKLIFMEYIDKNEYKEFTIDMYYGRDNFVKGIVPRERLEVRAGEINKGYTRKNALVNILHEKMNYLPGVIGCVCVQLFFKEEEQDIVGIEINPRFGGGYPLSHYAKANFIEYLIKEYLLEDTLEYSDSWLDNTLMLRYDAEVIVYQDETSSCI